MQNRNPFKPSAGTRPPEIIGRTDALGIFERSLHPDSGTPGLSIITGARGIGKTVMLGAAQDLARSWGWEVVSETATHGVAERLREWTHVLAEDRCSSPVPGGLIITVDEIHAIDRYELEQLGAEFKRIVAEGRPVGLVVAGLPAQVDALLADEFAAFLRPADRVVLHNVAVGDVEESFTRTFATGDFDVPPTILHQAAKATGGYPYAIQLVGYALWREAAAQCALTPATATRAIGRAQERLDRVDLD